MFACDKGPPIPEKTFLKIYVDLLIVQDTTTVNNYSIDSVRAIVLSRHNISENQYDEMISYYKTDEKGKIRKGGSEEEKQKEKNVKTQIRN